MLSFKIVLREAEEHQLKNCSFREAKEIQLEVICSDVINSFLLLSILLGLCVCIWFSVCLFFMHIYQQFFFFRFYIYEMSNCHLCRRCKHIPISGSLTFSSSFTYLDCTLLFNVTFKICQYSIVQRYHLSSIQWLYRNQN